MQRAEKANIAVNLTGMDLDLSFSLNNIGLFFMVVLPTFIVCVLCVVALLQAKEMNLATRILLLSTLAANITLKIVLAVVFIGVPVPASNPSDGDF